MKRMWINQPATTQDGHAYHGVNVLASLHEPVRAGMIRVYFLSGDDESMTVPWSWLYEGWVK